MVCYKFLIVEEEGLQVSKVSVWVTRRKKEVQRHGTVSRFPGSGQPSLRRSVFELCNSHLSFGHIRYFQ